MVPVLGPVSLWVTLVSAEGMTCFCECPGTMWKPGFGRHVFTRSRPCLLSFFFALCGKARVPPCKGAAGLSLTFMFIPGVGWNNCELYFPLCGIKQRLMLLIIEIIQRVSTTFLSWNNRINSTASWELNLFGAQSCTSSRKKYHQKIALSFQRSLRL